MILWYTKAFFYYQKYKKPIQYPRGNIYLIHQCLTKGNLEGKGAVQCNYFRELPDWLHSQNKVVYRLPWLYDLNCSLDNFFKKIDNSKFLLFYDHISIWDIFWAFKNSLAGFLTQKYNFQYEGFDVRDLIKRERLKQFGDGTSYTIFALYAFYSQVFKKGQEGHFNY